jgi:drug/metabolite transporter (DMT)-like permease
MSSDTPDTLRAANRRGVLAMAAGMASFVANDSLVKYVSQGLPASELIFLRGVFATVLLLAIARGMRVTGHVAALLDRRVALRALFDAVGTVVYLTSLFHLPIANATAINMAVPLFITVLAVIAFGERVAPSRWLVIAVGFAGVLLVVQPSGAAFNGYALLCLAGALLQAIRDVMTRSIPRSIPSILVTLSTTVSVLLLAAVWGLFQQWQAVSWPQLGLLAAASVFLSSAYFLLIVSMRAGELSVVAPFRYTALLFAVVIGTLVWGDVPNALAWGGIALLVGSGVYLLGAGRDARRLAVRNEARRSA